MTGSLLKAGAITRGLGLIERGAAGVVDEFISFDKSITEAAAKFPEKIARGTKEFEGLEKAARKVGATTEFTSAQAAEGLTFLAMAGFSAEQSIAALPGVVDLATAANLEFAEASDIATDTLGAMGLATKDATQLTKNLARVNDVLAATSTSANTTVQEMFEAIKAGGAVATKAGASIETFSALLGIMANSGIKGEAAGTALRNMYLRLQAPVGGAKELIKKYVGDVKDANGNMRDMTELLATLKKNTKDLGTVQQAQILDTIFGKRAIAGANILLQEGSEELEKYRQSLMDAGGASKDMADKMRDSLENRLKTLKSAAVEVGFKFLEAFKEDGTKGIEAITEAIRKFDVKPVVEQAKAILARMKELFLFLWDHRDTIKTLVKAFIAFKVVMAGIGIAKAIRDFGALAKSIWKVVFSQKAMAKAGITTRAGLAPGQFGPAQAAPAAPIARVGDLTKTAQGVMTTIGGILGAAIAGVQIGMMIEESWLGPMNEADAKIRDLADNAVRLAKEALRLGDPKLLAQAQKDVVQSTKKMTEGFEIMGFKVPSVLLNTESMAGQLVSTVQLGSKKLLETASEYEIFGFKALGFLDKFAEQIQVSESPLDKYNAQLGQLQQASLALEQAMRSAATAAQKSRTQVDVNINGAPEGSTVTSKQQGPNAPAVNMGESGKN
jgi:TP901 family phage tail tape measure protein